MSKKAKGSSAKKVAVKKAVAKKPAPSKPVKKAVKPVSKAVVGKKTNNSKKTEPKKPVKKKAPAPKKQVKVAAVVKKAPKPVKGKVTKKAVAAPAKKTNTKTPNKAVTKATAKAKSVKVTKPIKKQESPKSQVSKPLVKKITPAPNQAKKDVKTVATSKPSKAEEKNTAKKEVGASKPASKEVTAGQDVIAINNNIPKVEREELPASKIASITSSITNPIKRTEAYAIKAEKEPNGKFEMEYITRASAEMLYEFLATPSGLSEWFCDDVNIRNGIYTFIWDGQMQQARLLKTIDEQLVRFQWVDKVDGSYFEFRIQRDELTNDISLIITDFAESKADQESAKLLWNNQVDKLMHVLGSVY